MNKDFPVVAELRNRKPHGMFTADDIARYADYIQERIVEHITKGHYTQEHAEQMTLANLYAGNDGE